MNSIPGISRRPAHVPEWVWEGFKRHLAEVSDPAWDPYDSTDITVSERIAFFTSIVASPNSESLWTALEAHREELDRHFDSPDPFGHVGTVLEAAHIICQRIHPQQRLTKEERRPLALAVSSSAEKLARSLEAIRALSRHDDPSLPDQFRAIDYHEVEGLLQQIREAAMRWLETKPTVEQPGRGDSERRYFVGEMTQYFEDIYAVPLNRVAGLLADCINFKEGRFSWAKSAPHIKVNTVKPPIGQG